MDGPSARTVRIPLRTLLLGALLLAGAAFLIAYALAYRAPVSMSGVVSERAPPLHAVIFRYDTELTNLDGMLELLSRDHAMGVRATAFPLTTDFGTGRNVFQRFALDGGEVQLHAQPMPRGMSDAYRPASDPTSYQYGYLHKDGVLNAYLVNLRTELEIMQHNGFPVAGLSLHSDTNRLPWDDTTNFDLVAAAAAHAGLQWVSVTSQAFSIGDGGNWNMSKFNRYDSEVTVASPVRWVKVRTGVFQSRETLVIPTSWRDSYPPSRDGSESEEQRFTRMLDDVNRQWKAAREVGAPLVLLIHPVHAVSRRGMHRNVMPRLKQAVVDQARAQDIPIMTFSEYHRRIEARR